MKFLETSRLSELSLEWARLCTVPDILDPTDSLESPVLLVLDMQNEFLTHEGQMPVWGGPAILPNVLSLISAFRQHALPVVFTRHLCLEPFRHRNVLRSMQGVNPEIGFLADGSHTAELHQGLVPGPNDIVIEKYRYSAFYDSPLDTYLHVWKRRQVIITGVASNICCDSTARDAFYRGYSVYFPLDGTGGIDEVNHLQTLRTMALSFARVCLVSQLLSILDRIDR